MAALTQDRNTPEIQGLFFRFPVAAGATIYAGAIVVLNASGFAEPGTTAPDKLCVGRAEARAVGGAADGDAFVTVRRGVFAYANSIAGDHIGRENINAPCYAVDDQTVALTDGTGTRSVCGTVMDVTSRGVWVRI